MEIYVRLCCWKGDRGKIDRCLIIYIYMTNKSAYPGLAQVLLVLEGRVGHGAPHARQQLVGPIVWFVVVDVYFSFKRSGLVYGLLLMMCVLVCVCVFFFLKRSGLVESEKHTHDDTHSKIDPGTQKQTSSNDVHILLPQPAEKEGPGPPAQTFLQE